MKFKNVRETLMDRTITVIADEGLDKTTTKAIVAGTGINEVYIYRNFFDKEDLLSKAFAKLDGELFTAAMENFSVMKRKDLDFEVRCRLYFDAMWKFLLGNREKCLTFVRYYYSSYFPKNSAEDHKKRYQPFLEEFRSAFKDEADVWMILNHILNVMLDFAVKVHNNHMPEDDDYAEHVFRVIYASIRQYFKTQESDI